MSYNKCFCFYKGNTKELQVSLFQALVLLLFNDRINIPYEDIRNETRIGNFIKMFLFFSYYVKLFSESPRKGNCLHEINESQ